MSEEKRALVVRIGGEAFIKCLQEFGSGPTMDLLVQASANGDWMAEELLVMIPATITLAQFLKRVPSYTVTKAEFEHWCKSASFCWGEKPPVTGPEPTTEEVRAILKKVGELMKEKAKAKGAEIRQNFV